MAYDQGYYQPPQRPYNGRAAQRPGPQGYQQQPPPPQQYPQQQYDPYAQDGYGYDDYNNGYAQDYNDGYHQTNGDGRGNGYPPQQQNYPQQQEYYGNDRGGDMPPRGGGVGGRGGPPMQQQMQQPMQQPMQRPPIDEVVRGGYDQTGGGQGRGYPNSGPQGAPQGRGGRPAPLDRSASSDPGQKNVRKPLKTPPISPDNTSWDNPFPTFPGAKKKTSLQEEQKIIQKMDGMIIQDTPTQNRPRTAGSKGSQDRHPNGGRGPPVDDYGRPSMDSQRRGPPPEDYGRPSGESQRMPPRGYPPEGPPQQGYQDPRRVPPPGQGNGYGGPPPRQNGYGDSGYDDRGYGPGPTSPMHENFGPPARSMTMPNEQPMGRQIPMAGPMDGPGPSAPYNGPVGRQMPPRPSTATGARPPPQRTYPPVQQPPQQQYDDPYNNGNYSNGHNPNESISEFYDSYYDEPDPRQSRPLSNGSEMPNFDAIPVAPAAHKRGASIDEHIVAPVSQPTGYQQVKPVKSQPDFRARAQPQAAVFEMANDAPRMPNAYPPQQGGYDDGYGAPNGQYNQPPPGNQRPPPQGYGGYSEPPPAQQGFQPPPRSTSAAPRTGVGLPNNPRPGLSGPPPNGPLPQPGQLPRTNTAPPQQKPLREDALPSHPVPVRPGLMPNSIAAQSLNNKPAPVRNYNNVGPAGVPVQPTPAPAPAQTPAPATAAAPIDTNQPVTIAELERLRKITQDNPNDQKTAMILVKRLVEASEVLVPSIPDQRARNKTREKYVMDANKILKKLVAAANPDAMFYLADCYGRGSLGLEADPKEAFTLYQHAAKIGHPAAAYRTAVCCELGNDDGGGTRKDPLKAMQWYKRSAMLGDTPAMYKMGMIQLKGLLGQQRNPREAVGWLKRAAERADAENPHALHELGLLYEQQQGNDSSLVRDESYSFKLFHQAAALGYKFSQFRLGTAYEYGLFNCTIDPRQSIMWYSRAAVQEEHQSELALSGWYLTGSEGVLQQSDTEAYLWARKAAMAGLAKAEYAMGYFTEVGIGAPANLEDAKRWYWRAAAQNFPKARERLEDLKRNGGKSTMKSRERISRSKVGKQNEGECAVM